MLKFKIKEDVRCFKAGTEISIELDKLKYMTVVGPNGCGKTTLFHALRAKFPRKKEINLLASDLKKLLGPIQIETDYQEVLFLDTVFDDGSDMMNAYDACVYIDSGGYARRQLSNGQKQLNMLGNFLEKTLKTDKKSLVVLDEIDTGLDLLFQNRYINVVYRLVDLGYEVIVISHSPLLMMRSSIVFDLETAKLNKDPLVPSAEYLEGITGYKITK